jgi:hypothetical protein
MFILITIQDVAFEVNPTGSGLCHTAPPCGRTYSYVHPVIVAMSVLVF